MDLARLPVVDGVSVDDAASSGEEYELLVAFPSAQLPDVSHFERRFGLPLTAIGEAHEGAGVTLGGGTDAPVRGGHDHLA